MVTLCLGTSVSPLDVSSPPSRGAPASPRRAGARGDLPLRVRVALGVWIAGLAALSLILCRPPAPKPASAPPDAFSAERALEHVRAIARAPRPTGSPGNREAREYVLEALRKEGLSPEVQATARSVSSWRRTIPGGVIHNIIATLPGSRPGAGASPALLLMSHYDTVAGSPGASDDGAAVAAMLEALRALRAGPPLSSDIVLLFTDAEELGLAGAEQFVGHHPLAGRVGAALNFEARGARGPVYMFETGEDSAGLIEELAASGAPVFANSLSAVVYRLMPNATDFTIFRRRGMRGLAFAYIGGLRHYHAASDTVENLDPGSLQHHGEYMVGLARRLAGAGEGLSGAESSGARGREAVYFNPAGSIFIFYASGWALPLACLAALALGGAVMSGVRRKSLRPARVVLGLGALVGSLVAAFLVVLIAWSAARGVDARFRAGLLSHEAIDDPFYGVAVALLAAGVAMWAGGYASRWARPAELLAGHLGGWLLFSVVSALWLKGASHLAGWPLMFGAASLYGLAFSARGEVDSLRTAVIASVAAAPVILLLVPTLYAVFLALSLVAAPAVAPLITLFLGLLWPLFAAVVGDRKRWLASAMLLGAGAALTLVRALSHL